MNMHDVQASLPIKPTKDTYDRLQQAYEHFNKGLFGGMLPNALITLQRRKGTYGYFAGDRFTSVDGKAADEIALNPQAFADQELIDVLAILAHEMVHLWQHRFGMPGRGRYHNREWAEKMKEIGLQPTDGSADGSKETGDRITHVIVAGGPFENAARKLIARDFALIWKEVPVRDEPAPAGEGAAQPEKSGKRVRYDCPECDLKAWAKHDALLLCGEHKVPMLASD
jgi:predicted SprT family Zn-dependent metalloprotease